MVSLSALFLTDFLNESNAFFKEMDGDNDLLDSFLVQKGPLL